MRFLLVSVSLAASKIGRRESSPPQLHGYNRNVKLCVTLCLALLLLGCHKNIENKEAVRQGVLDHLAKRTDLSAMDVRVDAVSFHGNDAEATVYIQAKSGPPGLNAGGMQMKYNLERKDDKWVVKTRPGSSSPHGGANGMQMPMPLPPGAAPQSSTPALPPGHPQLPSSPSGPPK